MPSNLPFYNDVLRDPLDSFTDREQILNLFDQFLRSAQPGRFRLLAIRGNSGTGKTFLISYLTDRVCPQLQWQSGYLSFSQSRPNFRAILAQLEQALESYVPSNSFQQYCERRDEYNRRFDEYRASITFSPSVIASDHASISGVNQSLKVETNLREREIQLRHELTGALKELFKTMPHPLCVFIDSYERLAEGDSEIVGWLWEEVFLGLAKAALRPLLVVTCGWEYPKNATIQPFSYSAELTDFGVIQVKSYLEKQGVIAIGDSIPDENQALTDAFYELTMGHPLVLGLAVAYFNGLSPHERSVKSLRANRLLVDEHARVQFLEERLLSHLPEPYRTLLERGPILRFIDQATLQVLLSTTIGGKKGQISMLDDRSYSRFLQYPFIQRISTTNESFPQLHSTFHDLVRRVRLEALRHHHPQTKELLHRAIADYYDQITEMEEKTAPLKESTATKGSESEMPEREFRARLEYFYHALQVTRLQTDVFEEWSNLIGQTVIKSHQRTEMLLAIVEQLEAEGEAFPRKTSRYYARYLLWRSRSCSVEGRWEEALAVLDKVARLLGHEGISTHFTNFLSSIGIDHLRYVHEYTVFYAQVSVGPVLDYIEQARFLCEQVGNPADFAQSLDEGDRISVPNEMLLIAGLSLSDLKAKASNPTKVASDLHHVGSVFQKGGMLEEALAYYNRALTVSQQVGDLDNAALNLSSIGYIYNARGELEQALSYFEQALNLSKQTGNPIDQAVCLNNIGRVYSSRGQPDQALSYYLQALHFCEQGNDLVVLGATLDIIGSLYQKQRKFEQALVYYYQAQALSLQSSNSATMVQSFKRIASVYQQMNDLVNFARYLNNIGFSYYSAGDIDKALGYYELALNLSQQEKDALVIALCLNNIGLVYTSQGKEELALSYYMQALPLFKQANDLHHFAITLDNIGSIYYDQQQLEQALNYCKQALTLFEGGDHPIDTAMCLTRIGHIHRDRAELDQALSYYGRTVAIYEQSGKQVESAQVLHRIGEIYYAQGKPEQALQHLEQALSHYEQYAKVSDPPTSVAQCLRRIGDIYNDQGNTEQALIHLHRALHSYLYFYVQIGDDTQMGQLYNDIGALYYNQGKFEQALEHFQKALPFIERINDPTSLATCFYNIDQAQQRNWTIGSPDEERGLNQDE